MFKHLKQQLASPRRAVKSLFNRMTEREKALQASEAKLKATLDAIPDLLFELGLDGRYYAAHSPRQDLLVAPKLDLLGKMVSDVMPADAAQVVLAALQEAHEQGHSNGKQLMLNLPTGQRHFELSVASKPMCHGESPRFIVLSRDITDRKQAQMQLIESEASMRAIIQNEPECIKLVDPQGCLMQMNPAGLAIIEADSLQQVLGCQVLDVVAPEYRDNFAELHQRVLAGESVKMEFEVIGLKGRRRWVETSAVPIEKNGAVVQLAVTRDVTAHKLLQAEVRLHRDHLQQRVDEQTASLKAIVDTAADGIITIDRLGTVLSFNAAAQRIFGYRADEVINSNIRQLMPEPYHSAHDDYLQAYQDSGVSRVIGKLSEVLGLRKDGSTFPLHLSISEMQIGKEQRFTGIVRDISAQKEAELALIQARDQAERANRAKSKFLSSMSHELRTPLNAVLGFSQLLGMNPALSHEARDQVSEIENAGLHLLALVNNLFDLSRLESGSIELSLEPVALLPVLTDCLATAAVLAKQHGIGFEQNLQIVACEHVNADALRLRQVLNNLLSNAIKYNRPQGTVTASCTAQAGWVRFCVTDTGTGIAIDLQPRVFTAFDRLGKEAGVIEGAGIGLVISQRLAQAMGATIGFTSTEHVGSTFWIEFPLIAPIARGRNKSNNTASLVVTPAVLYIEDNPMNLRLVQKIFAKRADLVLLEAPNAEIGIEVALANLPALILMDINLPGMDGYAALELLKKNPVTAHIPVIAITANAMKGEDLKGLSAGFSNYITKPIDVQKFITIINSHFQAAVERTP